jgi:hypothetical protein
MIERVWWLASLVIVLVAPAVAKADDAIGYNRSIRPILADNCFTCHGPDSAARKADLRLDQRDAAIESGALVPGKPEESELIKRILSTDPETLMPPESSHKKLTPAQQELLAKWVAAGAVYEPHWSFIAPARPAPPVVQDKNWARGPLDDFVLARLEAAGLKPAPEADRRTLARRASLDLTGLPPEPAEVEAFVNDASMDAYEKYVDRLLSSTAWGEHRGRAWLDAARYADTHGIHFDNYREMWSYRDWVINAFNRNMPFDQFTIEQLAGDLIANKSLDQTIASGFNRCNMTTNEGGVIAEEYLVLYTRDRTETVSQVYLGLTMNCAVCHDHKFDPITQREFYEMAAFFNNTTQNAMDGNIKDTPPIVVVPPVEDRATYEALGGKLAAAQKQIDDRRVQARGEFDAWLAAGPGPALRARQALPGLVLHAPLGESSPGVLAMAIGGEVREVPLTGQAVWAEGFTAPKAFQSKAGTSVEIADVGDFEKDQPFTCSAWVKVPRDDVSGAIAARMDDGDGYRGWDLWLDRGRPSMHLVHQWPDDAVKVIGKTAIKPGKWHYVSVAYDGSGTAGGVKVFVDAVEQQVEQAANSLKHSIRTRVPFKLAQRHASSRVDDLAIQDLRIYNRALPAAEISQLAMVSRAAYLGSKPTASRTAPETDELYAWWLETQDSVSAELVKQKRALTELEAAIKARSTIAHVAHEKNEPAMAHVLFRGEYDKRRDQVSADTPDLLPPFAPELPRNRLGLAQWLLRPEHPLTARVTVNRFWQEVFGAGLVRTTGEFGVGGELPTHQDLLDWLAVEFRESGWDVKRLFKVLVTSAAYRQSAQVTPEKLEKDPQNRLLSRGPRFRMDAEMVRDYALACSGLLVRKQGGPSVRPYQPDGVWEAVAMIGSNTRDYKHDSVDNLYRRSLYTFWKRAAPPASMDIFNAPSREVCTVRRERTNTPLQALVTLNDPQFVEAARNLAQRTLREGGDSDAARLQYLAMRLLGRPLAEKERPLVESSLASLLAYYREHAEDAKAVTNVGESRADATMDVTALAGWTMLANELMNMDEVLNK